MAVMLFKWLAVSWLAVFSGSGSKTTQELADSKAHPFYLAVTEISHNTAAKTLEVSCKMFADDFEAILEKNYKTTLDITTEKDKASFDKFIPDYISKHLTITIDGKPAKLDYVGFENDKESAYVYLEVQNISSAKKVAIHNSLLYDFIDQQINILHVTINGNRQSTKLVYPGSETSFNF